MSIFVYVKVANKKKKAQMNRHMNNIIKLKFGSTGSSSRPLPALTGLL